MPGSPIPPQLKFAMSKNQFRHTHTHIFLIVKIQRNIKHGIIRLNKPKTKEAASMPPWRPLKAGLFLQST